MTILKTALSGVWGQKERSEATRGPLPRRAVGPAGLDSKGEYCAAVLPQLRPFDLRPDPKKKTPQRSWGASITPNFEGLGFPRGSKSKRACEVERLD